MKLCQWMGRSRLLGVCRSPLFAVMHGDQLPGWVMLCAFLAPPPPPRLPVRVWGNLMTSNIALLISSPINYAGWLYEQLYNTFNNHEPLVDLDGDKFSVVETFRGTSWRGKDCNDFEKSIHPGRKENSFGVRWLLLSGHLQLSVLPSPSIS